MNHQAINEWGIVGLGVMGSNIALNIEEKGFPISVYNRSREKTDRFVEASRGKKVTATYSLEEFAATLTRPRKILIMVKAGQPVDATIEALLPYLNREDVVIDGGNEFYERTQDRQKRLEPQGISFIGMGVSGGEEGARHGPSIMPSGDRSAYQKIEEVLQKIAAQVDDGPCVTYIGPGGSGHFVKMVHNGIEYGDMQLIAETYDILRRIGGLSNGELADVFAKWNEGELESFLIEITSQIFRQKDDLGEGDLIDAILDTAKMKGTGSWTVQQGAELASAIPTIASSVDARMLSALKSLRKVGAQALNGPSPKLSSAQKAEMVEDARQALYSAKTCSYAQGIDLLGRASVAHKWALPLANIARIWKGGCIIRASFLGRIQSAFSNNPTLANLLFDDRFGEELSVRQKGWRRTMVRAIEAGVAIPSLSASLSYYDSLRTERLPANLVQAQRDFFGAHTYQRLDREGTFHTEWTN